MVRRVARGVKTLHTVREAIVSRVVHWLIVGMRAVNRPWPAVKGAISTEQREFPREKLAGSGPVAGPSRGRHFEAGWPRHRFGCLGDAGTGGMEW